MQNKTLITRKMFGFLRVLLTLCACGMLLSQVALAQDQQQHRKAEPAIQAAPIRFLFLYREGSISTDVVKQFVEGAELTIKTKSSPARLAPGAQKTELEELTLEELGMMLSGAKLTKADAARRAKSPTLGELFQKYGPVLVFNARQSSWCKGNCCPEILQKQGCTCWRWLAPCLCLCLSDAYGSLGSSDRLIVITFNQTAETEGVFKKLFCTLYQGDCVGPVGKPTPLPDPVTVRKYARMDWNEPIKDERALQAALQKAGIGGPIIKSGDQPQLIKHVICRAYNPVTKDCTWWEVCNQVPGQYHLSCYDLIYEDGKWWIFLWY